MLTISGRGVGLASAVRATAQAVGGRTIAPSPAAPLMAHFEEREHNLPMITSIPYEFQWQEFAVEAVPKPIPKTSFGLSKTLFTRQLTVGTGIGGQQLRYFHNDLKIPDFDAYRRDSTKDPTKTAVQSRDERRIGLDLAKVGVGIGVAIAAKRTAQGLAAQWAPGAHTLALGVIEVDLSTIPEGKNITIKWNNKPVFVRHRTAEEIARERAVNHTELRDPQTDEERSVTGKWLIVMANCTHLGCVPISNQGNWGGYYCPCHGSHYDASGRIRKGPAPLNLEVPDHHIIEAENKLVLGLKAPA